MLFRVMRKVNVNSLMKGMLDYLSFATKLKADCASVTFTDSFDNEQTKHQ